MNYGVGDTVNYRNHLGGNPFPVTVTEKDPNVRNGRPGFVGVTKSGEGVWGYDTQIRAITRAPLTPGVLFTMGTLTFKITGCGATHVTYDSVPTVPEDEPVHHRTTIEAFRNLHAADMIRLVVAA